jgi:hypothetical protein
VREALDVILSGHEPYPAVAVDRVWNDVGAESAGSEMLGPVKVRTRDGELSFFGMFASFDTPFEVTTSELAVELLFPADRTTAQALHALSPALRAGG